MKSCGGSKLWSCDTEDHSSDDRDGRERLKKIFRDVHRHKNSNLYWQVCTNVSTNSPVYNVQQILFAGDILFTNF